LETKLKSYLTRDCDGQYIIHVGTKPCFYEESQLWRISAGGDQIERIVLSKLKEVKLILPELPCGKDGIIEIESITVKAKDVEQITSKKDIKKMDEQSLFSCRPLGRVLLKMGLVTRENIHQALIIQKQRTGIRVGQVLIEMGLINDEQLDEALELQKPKDKRNIKIDTKILKGEQ